MLTAIAAVSDNWGIGLRGGLLFSIPEDMKFFRETTAGSTVIMGRKTLQSFPGGKPLKGRNNLVLSRSGCTAEGVTVFRTPEELMEYLGNGDAFVIGGGEVYRLLLPYCEKALITKVQAAPEADTFFPNLDSAPDWVLSEQSAQREHEGLRYSFCTYIRS